MAKHVNKALHNGAWMDLPICIKIKDQINEDLAMLKSLGFDQSIMELLQEHRPSDSTSTGSLMGIKFLMAYLDHEKFPRTDIVIRIVVKLFIILSSKRVLASMLENIGDDALKMKIVAALTELLKEFLVSILNGSSMEECVYTVDLLSICLCHSFGIGRMAIRSQLTQVLRFLQGFLKNLLATAGNDRIEKFEHYVSATLKCAAQICRKYFFSEAEETVSVGEYAEILDKIVLLCKVVLIRDNFGWDCYNVAAMTWLLVWRIMLDEDSLLKKIKGILASSFIKNYGTLVYDDTKSSCDENYHRSLKLIPGLSFCNGTLVTIDAKLLVHSLKLESENKQCFLLNYILHCLRMAEERCKALSDQLALSKCFVQITATMLEVSTRHLLEFRGMLLEELSGNRSVLTDLLYYAVEKLEHPTDSIRYQANEMLRDLLALGANIDAHEISSQLLEKVLHRSWQKRSTFSALNCALQFVDPKSVFDRKPDILERLLDAMQHQTLAPYSSETYKILASRCWKLLNKECSAEHFEAFIGCLLSAMCNSSTHSLHLLIDYCFIKLLRVYGGDCIEYVLNNFKHANFYANCNSATNTQSLSAFLSCLRTAELKGYLIDQETAMNDTAYNALIRYSLIHQDDEIRHLGFALFCESVKPSKLVSGKTLDCLKSVIPFNVCCQDPAFRQKFLNSLKKLFLRLNGGVLRLLKRKKHNGHSIIGEEDSEENLLNIYQDFISWVFTFAVSQLCPSAPYPKRITCFSILHLAVDIFLNLDEKKILNLIKVFTPGTIDTLFDMLSDPYEDIKHQSFSLLSNSSLRTSALSVFHQERRETVCAKALQHAYRCAKPEWCDDAAYHLKLFCTLDGGQKDLSYQQIALRVCSKVLCLLNDSISVAERNLYLAATTSPMYGLLHCLRIILQSIDFRSMVPEAIRQWHDTTSHIISTCIAASKAALLVVGSVSPEGHLPDLYPSPTDVVNDEEPDDAWNELPDVIRSLAIGGDDSDERKTRALAQQILICCWRSVKESSLLLQEISSQRFPLHSSKTEHDGVLAWDQLLQIGEHLRKQLMEARHRGAFEITYSSFATCCHRLWNMKHEELCKIPEIWLESVLLSIQDPFLSNGLCATRRSAGLPFFVQALLSGNKSTLNKKHLDRAMSVLLSLCEVSDSDIAGLTPKVHSLNVLRGLVKDSSLGEEIFPYVSQSLQVSLIGFNSSVWAVRNSSTLLFSALFNRIFGVKRDKYDDLFLKNRLSGNELFSRLPGLHSFLLKQLEKISESLNKGDHRSLSPTLYPVFLLLSRIYPSTIPSTAGNKLDDFAPLLINCRGCPVYKTRVSAARALASILRRDQRLLTLEKCCENLLKDMDPHGVEIEATCSATNRIHGGLLQIKEILHRCMMKNENYTTKEVQMAMSCVSRIFHYVMPHLATRQNSCPLTRSLLLEIFLLVCETRQRVLGKGRDAEWSKLSMDVRNASVEELMRSCAPLCQIPGYMFLLEVAAKISLSLSDKFADILSLLEELLHSKTDALYALLNALTTEWEKAWKTWSSKDFILPLEKMIVNALLRSTYSTEITTLMYRVLFEVGGSVSAEHLLEKSMAEFQACNPSRSALLEALINFQSRCIALLYKKTHSEVAKVLEKWISVVYSLSRCYENAEDIRLAVANSLLANVTLLHDTENRLGGKVVQLWIVVIHLLCDEESDIRKVASQIVCKAVTASAYKIYQYDHPCVDCVALRHALATLILTHGQRHSEECRKALIALAEDEPQTVPVCSEVRLSQTESLCEKDFLPGFFERSRTNVYIDMTEIVRLSRVGVGALDSAMAGNWVQTVVENFDCTS